MNTNFTTKKGFYIPILKYIQKLNRGCTQNEIISLVKSSNFIDLLIHDLETIDFNGKYRFEYAITNCFYSLVKQGFLLLQEDTYSITSLGLEYINTNLDKYDHNDYIHNVEISSKNKYIYSNLPSYLVNTGNRKTNIYGFNIHSNKYIEILNDYLDFIDLNYPSAEELCTFLKNNYGISTNSECLNEINVIRSCGLVKVMGKNIALTKLGEWYINSYDNIALFRIFSSIFNGFEEIVYLIANDPQISIFDLRSKLNFEWKNSKQFDIRINWLSSMKIIIQNDSCISLSDIAIEFAQFLGIIDIEEDTVEAYPLSEQKEDEVGKKRTQFTKNSYNSKINLSQQERNFLLNNNSHNENKDQFDDIDDYFDNALLELYPSSNEDSVYKKDGKRCSNVIEIANKHGKPDDSKFDLPVNNDTSSLLITHEDISNLVDLPDNIIFKITAAINMRKHIIITGPNGSGKTSLAVILAKIANKKGLNNGYNLVSAAKSWNFEDTIGNNILYNEKNHFKEGFLLKSIREDKWLIIDEINKCNTETCFGDFLNSLYGHNTILTQTHENYKNIEIISDPHNEELQIHQYFKNREWRLIATMDNSERQSIDFSSSFIRRFAFIDLGAINYSSLIDKYFEKNNLQNDLLKSKIKTLFNSDGLLKYKEIGSSSLYDLINYISIRSILLSDQDNIYYLLAEALEIYILPQLQLLDGKIISEIRSYLLVLFDDYENIKKKLQAVL